MENTDLVLSKYKKRKLLIKRILESGAEKVLNRFRGSSDYRGKVVLDFADLRGANFRYADLSDVSLIGANLSKVSFNGSKFTINNESSIVLRGALLFEADLHSQSFAGIDLAHANFTGAGLQGVNFSRAVLCGVVFDYADCMDAVFTDAVFKKTTNSDDDFGEVSFLNTNIYNAIFNEKRKDCLEKIMQQASTSVGDYLIKSTKRREKFSKV